MVDTTTNLSLEEETIFHQQHMGIGAASATRKRLPPVNRPPPTGNPEEKLHKLAEKSSHILFKTKTVFPFDLFPNTLTITANKIDIVNASFFGSNQITSVPLRDIANVEVQTSPFLATIRIINIRFPMHPNVIRYLKKSDAIEAKKIIDGLLVALSQGADIAEIEPEKLLSDIEKLGGSAVDG
jgi:hypothetical protein